MNRKIWILVGFAILFIAFAANYAGAESCLNNWQGGACTGPITYTANTNLFTNVSTNGIIVLNSGVQLDTNGFVIYTKSNIYINGIITTGIDFGTESIGDGNNGQSFSNSYAGSGGGGGSQNVCNACGGNGGNTKAAGGITGGDGGIPSAPSITNANIQTWQTGGFINYLTSGGGGGGYSNVGADVGEGANSVYGLYIQANYIYINPLSGYISANGITGQAGSSAGGGQSGGGGGSGGGTIILAYGSAGYSNTGGTGTYSVAPGAGGAQGGPASPGGSGGYGQFLTYQYTTPPITLPIYPICTNNWEGSPCTGNIIYTQNTFLYSDINATGNLVINIGVSLFTNGSSIWITNSLIDNGVIYTENSPNTGAVNGDPGTSFLNSFGGSGGGGFSAYGLFCGNQGGNTLANAGLGFGGNCGSLSTANGVAASAPTVTNPTIQTWYNGGFQNYLIGGAGGAGADSSNHNLNGANSPFGIYIQANTMTFNSHEPYAINVTGLAGQPSISGAGGGNGGCSGGGVIILAYGSIYSAGSYEIHGANSISDDCGGAGGNGQVAVFQYTTQPIPTTPFSYNPPSNPTLMLSNTFIDQGQSILFTAGETNGNQLFTYNYLIINTITTHIVANQLYVDVASNANTFFFTPLIADIGNTLAANVIITEDGAYSNTINTIYTPIGYNSMPTITANSISNTLIDSGQYTTFTVTEAGGTGAAFNALLYNITSGTQQASNRIITALGGSNTITIKTASLKNSNSFTYNWIISDTGTTTEYVFNSISNSMTVNTALGIPSLSVSITPTVTTTQSEVFTASFLGGTSPYTYNFQVENIISNTILANMLIANSFTTNTFTWVVPAADGAGSGNTFRANVIITDGATTNVIANSVYSSTVTITSSYSAPPTPALILSNVLVDQGQSTLLTGIVTGGIGSYTYNFQIVNAISGTQIANMLYTSDSSLQATWLYTPLAATLGNTLKANVVITDAHPTTVNSVYNSIGYNSLLLPTSVIPLSSTQSVGSPITVTSSYPNSGTATYGYDWLVYDSNNNIVYNTGSFSSANTLAFSVPYQGTFYANVLVQDSATTMTTANSVPVVIIGTAPQSSGGSTGGGGIVQTTTIPANMITNTSIALPLSAIELQTAIYTAVSDFLGCKASAIGWLSPYVPAGLQQTQLWQAIDGFMLGYAYYVLIISGIFALIARISAKQSKSLAYKLFIGFGIIFVVSLFLIASTAAYTGVTGNVLSCSVI